MIQVGEASVENLKELATTNNIYDGNKNTSNYYEHLLNHDHDHDNHEEDKEDARDENVEWTANNNIYFIFNDLHGAKLQVR